MTEPTAPRLYLTTPAHLELSTFPDTLSAALDTADIACLRLSLVSRDEDDIARAADTIRTHVHARDIPLVLDDHHRLAERLGLDGVHLTDGPRRLRDVRKALGQDAIIGAFCGTSRHDGLTAAEIGADYVSFGPVSAGLLGDGSLADPALFQWWSEMIEVPVVAEGGLTPQAIPTVAPFADFLCLGDEIWRHPDGPARALGQIAALIA